jgi:hypothetical protein
VLWLFGRRVGPSSAGTRWKYLSREIDDTRRFIAIEHRPEFLKDRMYRSDYESFGANQRTLVRIEPPVVNPWQYRNQVEMQFGQVINEDCLSTKQSWFAGYFDEGSAALLGDSLRSCKWQERPIDVVAVMANKFSFERGELYSLRRKAWSAINQSFDSFSLFGRGWGDSPGRTLGKLAVEMMHTVLTGNAPKIQGQLPLRIPQLANSKTIDSPYSAYRQARIAVVIENYPNRVTEKIYQAIESGCRVLYVGGNAAFLRGREPLVHRAEPNLDSIQETLRDMLETDTATSRVDAEKQAVAMIGSPELQMGASAQKLESLIIRGSS